MIKKLIALATLSFTCAAASALEPAPAQIVEKFKAMYPATAIREVRKSELPGIYEIVTGQNVAYTDETGRYFLFGHIFDMQQQVDLTAQRQGSTQAGQNNKKVEFPSQFLGNAIKVVKGDGSRKVAIFTDPDCPYCKRLESELAKLNNVTIYYFLYPLEGLHPEAKTKAVSVWCSPNKEKAWSDLMQIGQTPKLVACNNPINDNLVLGSRLGVNGTPTLIAGDGRIMPGAAPAAAIDQWLGSKQ
jgi:thiol:disulfide interchange protein DsbC